MSHANRKIHRLHSESRLLHWPLRLFSYQGFVDVAIGFDRVPLSIDSRSSPPSIVSIISLRFLLSPPFSINLCNLRRSHDIDVVDLYSDLAILAVTEMQLVNLKILMLESAR